MMWLVLALAMLPITAQAQTFNLSPDQVFAAVGRCTVETNQLRAALQEAQAKIAELTARILPPPPIPDTPKE